MNAETNWFAASPANTQASYWDRGYDMSRTNSMTHSPQETDRRKHKEMNLAPSPVLSYGKDESYEKDGYSSDHSSGTADTSMETRRVAELEKQLRATQQKLAKVEKELERQKLQPKSEKSGRKFDYLEKSEKSEQKSEQKAELRSFEYLEQKSEKSEKSEPFDIHALANKMAQMGEPCTGNYYADAEKLYRKLQLDQVDQMPRVAAQSFIKDLLLRSNTPLDEFHDEFIQWLSTLESVSSYTQFIDELHRAIYGSPVKSVPVCNDCLAKMKLTILTRLE